MPWGRLDDSLYDHPKLDRLPEEQRLEGVGLWAVAISWSNRFLTDGHLPRSRIEKLGGTIELAESLVTAEMFDHDGSGYRIHDFLDFNDSRADVMERRQKEAERKAAYRAGKRGGGSPAGSPNGTSSVSESDVPQGVPPSVPVGQTRLSRAESRRVSRDSHARASAGAQAHPVPSRPVPSESDSPKSPQSGDHSKVNPRANGTNPRAQGTSPRQVAAKQQAKVDEAAEAKRWRRNQRALAYARGAITESQQVDMDQRDAPLAEIPDWEQRLASLNAEWLGTT